MRIIDRYLLRAVLWPLAIGLLVFTFLLIIPFLIELAETFISKGVGIPIVIRLMATLLPQALGLTIPMSLLLGLLVALSRLSADRELVAMQACGMSLTRLLRPVGVLSTMACAATGYVLLVAVPNANQSFREITFSVVASLAEGEVRPRVFFEDFPNLVLYVRDVPTTGGGWNQVFMADDRPGQTPAVYLADRGRVIIDRSRRTVELVLEHGTRHTADASGRYEVFQFDRLLLDVDAESMFPREGPQKGVREMSLGELRARAIALETEGTFPHTELFEIQKKFSIPAACLVFGLIGLALGATNRRDGKLASFVLGIAVIFAYYVLLWFGQSLVRGHVIPPWLGAWLPNVLLGGLGALLFMLRDGVADRARALALPAAWRRADPLRRVRGLRQARRERGPATRAGIPGLPGILDRYVTKTYLKVLALAIAGMAGIFYISSFLDLSDKVFKGDATWVALAAYLWYSTPQNVYYILPMAVLLATLVTVGVLTKHSELVVMKACGISLYRVALPMLIAALVSGGLLFVLEESILGASNRRAEAIRHVMRGGSPLTFDVLNRRWVVGSRSRIYHYGYYDPLRRQLGALSVYEFDEGMRELIRRSYAERARFVGDQEGTGEPVWVLEGSWARTFGDEGDARAFSTASESRMAIESAAYFATQAPDPDYMTYSQLRRYVGQLRASGYDVLSQQVALERKLSFPFVTMIMTLIAIPFAVTVGRHGAMFGIGAGIVLALAYWVAFSMFAAFGSGGLLPPALAAWAPNLLFGAGAAYLLLTAQT